MKQGKKPTVNQRRFIFEQGLDSRYWLVTKDTPELIEIVHRESENIKRYNK